jgi:hypothetical protein
MARLADITGDMTLEMFAAAAQVFMPNGSPSKPLKLQSLAQEQFNRVSDKAGNAAFAISNADADYDALPKKLALAPVENVLTMLSQPGFFQQDVKTLVTQPALEHMAAEEKTNPEYKDTYAILSGNSDSGLSLHMVAAAGKNGKPEALYLIEDLKRGQCLVIGDTPITREAWDTLKDQSLSYVSKSETRAAPVVDDFFAEAAAVRGKRPGDFTADILLAFSCVCEIPKQFMQDGGYIIGGVKPGAVMTATTGMPTMYTSVAQLKQ